MPATHYKRANNYIQEDVTQLALMVSPVVFTSPFGESGATVISLISTLFRICESIPSVFLFISESSFCCQFRSKSSCSNGLRLKWNIAGKQHFSQTVLCIKSASHRITEQSRLEGTSGNLLAPPCCSKQLTYGDQKIGVCPACHFSEMHATISVKY